MILAPAHRHVPNSLTDTELTYSKIHLLKHALQRLFATTANV